MKNNPFTGARKLLGYTLLLIIVSTVGSSALLHPIADEQPFKMLKTALVGIMIVLAFMFAILFYAEMSVESSEKKKYS